VRQRQITDVQPRQLTGAQTLERGEHHHKPVDRMPLQLGDVVGHRGDLGSGQPAGSERLGVGIGVRVTCRVGFGFPAPGAIAKVETGGS
jgi:hypothetical protein